MTAEGMWQFPSKNDLCFGERFAKFHQHFPVIFIFSPSRLPTPCDTKTAGWVSRFSIRS